MDGRKTELVDETTGIRIFIRRPETWGAPYYHKFNFKKKPYWLKLLPKARESFIRAKQLREEIIAGRFAVLDLVKERAPQTRLKEIFARYETLAAAAVGIEKKTVQQNIKTVRNIFRHTVGTPRSPSPGGEGWGEGVKLLTDDAIDAKPSTDFNARLLEEFKLKMLASVGADRLDQDRIAITVNSMIRQARSLFSKKLPLNFYHDLILPDIIALREVHLLKEPAKGFHMPSQSVLDRIQKAVPALAQSDPNCYIIYLLSYGSGLRPGEIKFARQHWIEPHPEAGHVIRMQNESDFRIKDNEERIVKIEPWALEGLRAVMIPVLPGQPDYILRGNKTERADHAFRRFSIFVKNCGLDRIKAAHEMRKIFGSLVTQQAGLRAAQEALGHSSYATTERYYAGQVNLPKYQIAPQLHTPEPATPESIPATL